ncbi:uncharacterized protein BXZ73DRAFT_46289 [Epithele typhae]|uniref:uncharacterized protein n=1 Tax=Epithele typhae TaxID=378194 RepID=UPI0020077296|nr:uncharacterized protein BXZ73DRAFT_46289 [Epithele typhae]KAH9933645.1 hypothetical protein BXZ73DRAFT_46289 [Epithele typhae]
MNNQRVALSSIPALTFYRDSDTLARRASPVPQLTCIGKACDLYQPEAVRCTNLGGSGTDVDWKCEADLPEALRFGRVEVSCEGWDGPGDSYVLKGSCGLQYRLVHVPGALRGSGADDPAFRSRLSRYFSNDPSGAIFMVIWVILAALLLYGFLNACLNDPDRTRRTSPSTRRAGGGGGGPSGGWFAGPGGGGGRGAPYNDPRAPPPPYSKDPPDSTHSQAQAGWRPGFWTGAALGGLGATLLNQNRQAQPARMYDWEERERPGYGAPVGRSTWFGGAQGGAARRRPAFDGGDRGEGPSNLGAMRTSVGLGGSNVR